MNEEYNKLLRLFVNQPFNEGEDLLLNEKQAHYIGTVMRVKIGKNIRIFNGIDGEWLATIIDIQRKTIKLCLVKQLRTQKNNNEEITLIFSPLKKSRLDFMVEKATELGVTRLCPVITGRSIVNKVNINRLQAICIEAAEQCERLDIPTVEEPLKFEKFLRKQDGNLPILACCERDMAPFIRTVIIRDNLENISVMIGPEGGFTQEEKNLMNGYPFVYKVTLGTRILRSETAALMALSVISTCGEQS